MTGFGSRF